MRITYYGHSAIQIETDDVTLLADPFITGNGLAEPVVSVADLNPDVILLTHAHGDHFGDTPQIAKQSNALVVSNFEITQYLAQKHGHEKIQPMNTGGSWKFEWGRVFQTYARHSSSFPDGTYGGNPNGFILHVEGRCIYLMGDTCPFAEMAWIGEEHEIDLAFVPIGDCFTMGPKDAMRASKMIRAALSVPVHYGTFPLIEVDVDAWVSDMVAAGLSARKVAPGETFDL